MWLGNYEKTQMKGILDNYVSMNYVNLVIWLGNYEKVQMKEFIDA